jgi:hypothetical protein
MADCAAVAIRLQRADHWLAQLEGQRGVLRGGLCDGIVSVPLYKLTSNCGAHTSAINPRSIVCGMGGMFNELWGVVNSRSVGSCSLFRGASLPVWIVKSPCIGK